MKDNNLQISSKKSGVYLAITQLGCNYMQTRTHSEKNFICFFCCHPIYIIKDIFLFNSG